MAKHPAKFIDACKRSKVDTDELAKEWLQDHKAELAETQIAFGMRLQVVRVILFFQRNQNLCGRLLNYHIIDCSSKSV